METKRILLAVTLSIGLYLAWNFVAIHMGWVPKPDTVAQNATRSAAPASTDPAAVSQDPTSSVTQVAPAKALAPEAMPVFMPQEGRLVTVETPLYKAVFHSHGGVLREFYLKRYRTSLEDDSPLVNLISPTASGQAPLGILLMGKGAWEGKNWALEGDDLTLDSIGAGVLRFIGEVDGVRLTRELTFTGDAYTIQEKLTLASREAKAVNVAFTFGATALAVDETPGVFSRWRYAIFGGAEPVAAGESQYNLTRVAWLQKGSFDEDDSKSDLAKGVLLQGNVSWMGVMNNYFMGAVSMDDPTASAKGRMLGEVYHALIGKTGVALEPGQDASLEAIYFIGPKESGSLEAAPNSLDKALDYGFFSIVAKPLIWLLRFLYDYVHNYGVAIVLMTIIIKILFWPLSQKSYRSMQQMKQLQPLMQRIREKYKDDKETMNREVMQLYKTYKVNPAGGCLPILVQLPVFFGLYQALLNAIELRHAPFISQLPFTDLPWLADLASPDPFFITPLAMGATMLLQQKMTPSPGDPTQAKILMLMPIVFTGLFLTFPSGLVVYWLINNVISIGQQWWQMRKGA
jgi:YidC/Oxa1 family membrane protein insertase